MLKVHCARHRGDPKAKGGRSHWVSQKEPQQSPALNWILGQVSATTWRSPPGVLVRFPCWHQGKLLGLCTKLVFGGGLLKKSVNMEDWESFTRLWSFLEPEEWRKLPPQAPFILSLGRPGESGE